jgi:glycogen operon protein
VAEGRHWVGLIDTAQPEAPPATYPFGHVYDVTGRSLCAFALEGAITGDLRQGVGSILDVTERPLE